MKKRIVITVASVTMVMSSVIACGLLGLMGGAAIAGGVLKSIEVNPQNTFYLYPGLMPATIIGAVAGVGVGILLLVYLIRKIHHYQYGGRAVPVYRR